MAKSMYKEQFIDLIKAAEAAEDSYRQYLIDTFELKNKYKSSQIKTLQQCLSKILQPDSEDTTYQANIKQWSDRLEQVSLNTNKIAEDIVQLMGQNSRSKRILEILAKTITKDGKIIDKSGISKKTELESQEIGMIIGNIKEHYFKTSAQKQIINTRDKNRLLHFDVVVKDVDNNKLDFLIQVQDAETIYKDKNIQHKKNGVINSNAFQYISNGVPLEYKARFNPMHLTTKSISTRELISKKDVLIYHHMRENSNFNQMVKQLELDVCRMVIIDKIDKGFPVFITSKAGTRNKFYILCSDMLKALKTDKGLKTSMLDISDTVTGFEDLRAEVFTQEQIFNIIRQDKEITQNLFPGFLRLDNADKQDFLNRLVQNQKKFNQTYLSVGKAVLNNRLGKTIKTNLWYGKK